MLSDTTQAYLSRLVGALLTGAGRAASLQHFTFRDAAGREFYLHIECTWRLTDETGVIAGRADYWRPESADTSEQALEAGDIGATLRDVRNEALRARIAKERHAVSSVAADRFGGAVLEFSNGVRLELFPDASPVGHDTWEFWRLFERGQPHFVVSSDGTQIHA